MSGRDLERRAEEAVRAALRKRITLERAARLMARIEEQAVRMEVRAIVAVCDAGGQLVALHRMDGGFIGSIDIAMNKAYTAVALQRSTKALGELSLPGAPLYGVQWTNGGRLVIFGGGEPLFSEGEVAGGLGVSGGDLDQDTALAEYGRRIWEEEP